MISITKLAVGPYDNCSYIVSCNETSTGVIIDAAAEPDRILESCVDVTVERVLTDRKSVV